jgi:5'-methylthioinosine phosphorylase
MTLAIIGGTGLTSLAGLQIARREMVHTPYGEPSAPVTHGELHGRRVIFLARHGYGHTIPPHRVNYRANIWALKHVGAEQLLAVAAVGSIDDAFKPGDLAFPEQIIDYTAGREHTYFDEDVNHIDFTYPYDPALRRRLVAAAEAADVGHVAHGCYAATQGPRLETGAEIQRLARDGATMVGMTGMPEAALARELDLPYATCAVCANWAAGLHGTSVALNDIESNLNHGMAQVRALLGSLIPQL